MREGFGHRATGRVEFEKSTPDDYLLDVSFGTDESHNVVTSKLQSEGDSDWHMPVIDLDFPCDLVPSSTPGHFHLYVDRITGHEAYRKVLEAMVEAGWVQRGVLSGFDYRGFTAVRLPWVSK